MVGGSRSKLPTFISDHFVVLFLIVSQNENKTIDDTKFNIFIRLFYNIVQFTSYFKMIKS